MNNSSLGAARPAWRAIAGIVALAVPMTLSACADDEVRELGAQSPEEAAVDSMTTPDSLALAATPPMVGAESTDSAPAPAPAVPSEGGPFRAGEDPDFAARMGWPVNGPAPLAGAIIPANRIVCYYGNPNSTRMGALGEFPKEEMLGRLRRQIAEWEQADPATPVKPCLHMVSVVAQGEPGTAGHYRSIMRDETVSMVREWAREVDGIFIVDIQVGTDDIRNILPRFEWILTDPDVHLAIDPEFYMKDGTVPGRKIGTMDAADINYAADYLANLVRENNLPPKVLVVHRFTQRMVTNYQNIRLRPEVQVVMHMDGWGEPWLKRDSYRDYVVKEPVQYSGFKIFYGNDTKTGTPIMPPSELLRLEPEPLYIQYQ